MGGAAAEVYACVCVCVTENDKLVDTGTLAEGDRWLLPPSYRFLHPDIATTYPCVECLLLCGRRARERRARVPVASSFSALLEAGGVRRVFGRLWRGATAQRHWRHTVAAWRRLWRLPLVIAVTTTNGPVEPSRTVYDAK